MSLADIYLGQEDIRTNMKYVLSLFLLAYCFSSCVSTNYISIDVRQPAEISLPPDVVNVVIVDNSPVIMQSETEENNVVKSATTLSTDSTLKIMLNSLQQYMSEDKYFYNISLYPYPTYDGDGEKLSPLTARDVQLICEENDADALLSIDIFGISMEIQQAPFYLSFDNSTILKSKAGLMARLYAKDGSDYSDPIILLDSLTTLSDISTFRYDNKFINSFLIEHTQLVADKLTSKLVPSWTKADRWYYSDNSSEMKQAAQYASLEQWSDAIKIWEPLYTESKTDKQIKIASNLALAYECSDNIDIAVKWIEKAFKLLPDKSNSTLALQVAAYASELTRRAQSLPKLHKQLGIDDSDVKEDY